MSSIYAFSANDVRVIAEEVRFLMQGGYRDRDRERIIDGLDIALEHMPPEEWRMWGGMPLRAVIDDLYRLGEP